MNLLFICTQNKLRSLTAEHLFRNNPLYSVRSAGTASNARRRVTKTDIHWAEVIFFMEKKHQEIIQHRFLAELVDKQLMCLDIPDQYLYMDEELIKMLEDSVESYLKSLY
jgi:predicted protein tyrosine phosphatase